jgi:hypothetical protein
MQKARKTPQEKKLLSYDKDRRNAYGERGSHSRHAIASQKAINRRTDRRRADQLLENADKESLDALESAELKAKSLARRGWRKSADTPLRVWVEHRLGRRKRLGINSGDKNLLKRQQEKA